MFRLNMPFAAIIHRIATVQIESDRLDLFHEILTRRCDGELHLAPLGPDIQRILDLGTGTGIWVIDMGEQLHVLLCNGMAGLDVCSNAVDR